MLPASQTAQFVNRSVEATTRLGRRTADAVSMNVDRSRQLIEAAGDIWTAGRDATLKRSEEAAAERGAPDTARELNRARRQLGAVESHELPIRNYDSLTAATTISRIDRLRDPDDVRTVLAYERANKRRKSVTGALDKRLQRLAADLAEAS